jgi:hypothetical protein
VCLFGDGVLLCSYVDQAEITDMHHHAWLSTNLYLFKMQPYLSPLTSLITSKNRPLNIMQLAEVPLGKKWMDCRKKMKAWSDCSAGRSGDTTPGWRELKEKCWYPQLSPVSPLEMLRLKEQFKELLWQQLKKVWGRAI